MHHHYSKLVRGVEGFFTEIGHAPRPVAIRVYFDDGQEFTLPINHVRPGPAASSTLTPLQRRILDALAAGPLRTTALALACDCDQSKLFRKGGLPELRERGLVDNDPARGFYLAAGTGPRSGPQ